MFFSVNRRLVTAGVGALPVLALGVVMTLPSATVPFAAEGPGPLFDVLGTNDGKPVIEIEGIDTPDGDSGDSATGQLEMTTVSVYHQITLPQVLGLWVDRERTVVPIETLFPPGVSTDEFQQRNAVAFADSEANATAAALRQLELPTEVSVAFVTDDAPAEGVLEENDVIVSVAGQPITQPEQVRAEITKLAPGDQVTIVVRRDGREYDEQVTLGPSPADDQVGYLGIAMSVQPGGDAEISYNVTGVGGPSAGLMLSLGVIDKLTPGDLTGGRKIAGTGTINASGAVGEIGGITHKIVAARDDGAEMFFVPAGNCAEALTADAGDTQLVKVETLQDALDAIDGSSQDAPSCQP